MFDPVSHQKINSKKAAGSADFEGTRYYFSSEENLVAFNADSKKFAKVPAKESMTCAVMGSKVASYSKAVSYVDYDNVRYYMCCAACTMRMEKDASKYAGKNITDPVTIAVKK